MEDTSYGQMRNILMYGRYQIGMTIQSMPVHTINDIISLKLVVRDKKLSKKFYNLDDLHDLENKLVLITGSKAENRTEVDHFLNVRHNIIVKKKVAHSVAVCHCSSLFCGLV